MLFWQLSSEKNYSRKMTTTELKNVVLSLFQFLGKNVPSGAVVVAQLVEQLLPKPEVCSLNPVIGKNLYIEHLFTVNCIEKMKIKKKVAGNGPFLKRM